MAGLYSAADYAGALRKLLPRGRVWPTDVGTVQSMVLDGLSQSFARLDSDAIALVSDAFPASTTNFIDEWEQALGLPDPCLGPSPTLQQRRDQVVARLAGNGGQSAQRFIDFAATLGFDVTVTCYAPFRAGRNTVGQPLNGPAWAHVWLITIISGATSADHAQFRVGEGKAGDPLASVSTALAALECEIGRISPAHTVLLFSI